MLDGIDEIDWRRVTHAYGSAADVPELLRSLLSPSENMRHEAMSKLFGNIWHQGTVYEATEFVVPFLIELLNDTQTPDKSAIACLLASIADGCGYLEVHARPEYFESAWRSILAKQGKDLDSEREREMAVTSRVRREAEKCLPLISTYISDAEPETRLCVVSALGAYCEHAATYLPILENALNCEQHNEVRHEITDAIRRLRHASTTAQQGDEPEQR